MIGRFLEGAGVGAPQGGGAELRAARGVRKVEVQRVGGEGVVDQQEDPGALVPAMPDQPMKELVGLRLEHLDLVTHRGEGECLPVGSGLRGLLEEGPPAGPDRVFAGVADERPLQGLAHEVGIARPRQDGPWLRVGEDDLDVSEGGQQVDALDQQIGDTLDRARPGQGGVEVQGDAASTGRLDGDDLGHCSVHPQLEVGGVECRRGGRSLTRRGRREHLEVLCRQLRHRRQVERDGEAERQSAVAEAAR